MVRYHLTVSRVCDIYFYKGIEANDVLGRQIVDGLGRAMSLPRPLTHRCSPDACVSSLGSGCCFLPTYICPMFYTPKQPKKPNTSHKSMCSCGPESGGGGVGWRRLVSLGRRLLPRPAMAPAGMWVHSPSPNRAAVYPVMLP